MKYHIVSSSKFFFVPGGCLMNQIPVQNTHGPHPPVIRQLCWLVSWGHWEARKKVRVLEKIEELFCF